MRTVGVWLAHSVLAGAGTHVAPRRVVNGLHRLLRDLHPGGAPTQLSADAAAGLLGRIRPAAAVDVERKAMVRALVNDLRRLDRALVESRRRCATAVAASGTTLTSIVGI